MGLYIEDFGEHLPGCNGLALHMIYLRWFVVAEEYPAGPPGHSRIKVHGLA